MTANLSELRATLAQKNAQLRQFADKPTVTAEEAKAWDTLLIEMEGIKTQIRRQEQSDQMNDFIEGPGQVKAAGMGLNWRSAAENEGDTPVDSADWREFKLTAPWGEEKTVRYFVPLAVQSKNYPSAFESYLRKGREGMGPQDRKTLSEGVDTAGGFLVPPDTQASILKKVATLTVIRARARVITTSRDMVKWPTVNYTTDDKYTSGVRITWTGEVPTSSTVHRVTDPVYGEENIPVFTAMASMPITNDLLEDAAFDVIGMSNDLMGEAFALGEDDVFINGSGINRPEGILTHPNASVIHTSPPGIYVKTTSAAALTAAGLLDLEGALPAQYERNAVFLMSKGTKTAIRKLADGASAYLYPANEQGGILNAPIPSNLMGYPLLKSEFMPAIAANAFPIIFGDLSGYLVADRVGLSIQVLRELYAETNIALMLARKRVGGQLVQSYRLRTHKCEA